MGERYRVRNPATEAILASRELQRDEAVLETVNRAREAFGSWRSTSPESRSDLLRRCAARLKARVNSLSTSLTREQGKPLRESKSEIIKAAQLGEYYAALLGSSGSDERRNGEAELVSRIAPEPLGVAAAIVPNNYPVTLLAYKVMPALAAGCTIVVKPDLQTSLTTELILECFEETGLPQGVLASVHCDNDTADRGLLGDEGVDVVSFTGSYAGGLQIRSHVASGNSITRMVLELGGVNSLIVEPDAPIEESLQGALYKAFRNAGQVCHGISSVYVHERLFDRWLERFLDRARRIHVGDGSVLGTEMGPLTTATRRSKIAELVEEAEDEGAVVHRCGLGVPERGWFYPPTVITGTAAGSRILNEELFSPVVVVEPYLSLEKLIASINLRQTGLVSYLYSGDQSNLELFASKVECATIGLNTVSITSFDAPFGGWKLSGLGYELGEEGLRNYQRLKHVRGKPECLDKSIDQSSNTHRIALCRQGFLRSGENTG